MKFQLGDVVDYLCEGRMFRGKVIKDVEAITNYPIQVDFGICTKSFTREGREFKEDDIILDLVERPAEYINFPSAMQAILEGKKVSCDDAVNKDAFPIQLEGLINRGFGEHLVTSSKWRVVP